MGGILQAGISKVEAQKYPGLSRLEPYCSICCYFTRVNKQKNVYSLGNLINFIAGFGAFPCAIMSNVLKPKRASDVIMHSRL